MLLLVYFIGTLEFNSIHSLFHSEHIEELHSAENEKEACHQAIYHYAKTGCEHKTHIVPNDKCPLCHLNIHPEQAITVMTWKDVITLDSKPGTVLSVYFLIPFDNNLRARAPPAC